MDYDGDLPGCVSLKRIIMSVKDVSKFRLCQDGEELALPISSISPKAEHGTAASVFFHAVTVTELTLW